jgi:ATP-dependent DNA ligase
MNRFATLIDRLATADDDMKHVLLADYSATTPEPDRTLAADILAAKLKPRRVKLALIRGLAEARMDPVLYALSLDYVGDVAETIALLWPPRRRANRDPSLSEVIEALSNLGSSELPKRIETWLDASDANGRWALIKLVTGTLIPSTRPQKSPLSQDEMFAVPNSGSIAGTIKAVLMYVERGKSKSSPTTCTFGLWKDAALVPVGKAVIGPGDDTKRIEELVRDNTTSHFGPVREVAPTLVLEIAFDGLQRSPRRKSGIALRGARIAAVHWDKQPSDAGALAELAPLLPAR